MSSTAQLFEVMVWTIDDGVVRPLDDTFLVLANEQSLALKKGVELAKRRFAPVKGMQFFATLRTSYRGRLCDWTNE